MFQDDVVMGTLSVRENLEFSASLRLSSSVSNKERKQRVETTLQELGLTHCADTKVCWQVILPEVVCVISCDINVRLSDHGRINVDLRQMYEKKMCVSMSKAVFAKHNYHPTNKQPCFSFVDLIRMFSLY